MTYVEEYLDYIENKIDVVVSDVKVNKIVMLVSCTNIVMQHFKDIL